MKFASRVTRITVAPVGEPLFAETAIDIEIDDTAAGEFIRLRGKIGSGEEVTNESVTIDPDEWPVVKASVETLLKVISDYEKKDKP